MLVVPETPVPESVIDLVVLVVVSRNERVPVNAAALVGVKVTLKVQDDPFAIAPVQVLVCVKPAPVREMFWRVLFGVMVETVTVALATGEVPPAPAQVIE